jgi:hypothetical protein
VILPRVTEKPKSEGFQMGLAVIPEHGQGWQMSVLLFQQYVTTVLIPFIGQLPTNDEFAGKPAVLLMDNCSIHTKPEVLAILREHDGKAIIFLPHMTGILQVLDLSVFRILKKNL